MFYIFIIAIIASILNILAPGSIQGLANKRALLKKAATTPMVSYCISIDELDEAALSNYSQEIINERACVICHRNFIVNDNVTIIKSCGHLAHSNCIRPTNNYCPGHQSQQAISQTETNVFGTHRNRTNAQLHRNQTNVRSNNNNNNNSTRTDAPRIKRKSMQEQMNKLLNKIEISSPEESSQIIKIIQETFGQELATYLPELPRFVIVPQNNHQEYQPRRLPIRGVQIKNFMKACLKNYSLSLLSIFPYLYILTKSLLTLQFNIQTTHNSSQAARFMQNLLQNNSSINAQLNWAEAQNKPTMMSTMSSFLLPHFLYSTLYKSFIGYTVLQKPKADSLINRVSTIGSSIKNNYNQVTSSIRNGFSWLTGRRTSSNSLPTGSLQQTGQAQQNNLEEQENLTAQKELIKKRVFLFLKAFFTGYAITHGAPLFPLIAGFYSSHTAPWAVMFDTFFVEYCGSLSGASLIYALGKSGFELYKQSDNTFLSRLFQSH